MDKIEPQCYESLPKKAEDHDEDALNLLGQSCHCREPLCFLGSTDNTLKLAALITGIFMTFKQSMNYYCHIELIKTCCNCLEKYCDIREYFLNQIDEPQVKGIQWKYSAKLKRRSLTNPFDLICIMSLVKDRSERSEDFILSTGRSQPGKAP